MKVAEIFDFLARSLSHDLGPSTLGLLERAASRLRLNPDRLSPDDAVVILKERIYPELQSVRGADEAQNKINELLDHLFEKSGGFTAEAELRVIDAQLRKFNFYFEWPEVQRLRGLAKVVRREMESGRDVNELLWSSWQELDVDHTAPTLLADEVIGLFRVIDQLHALALGRLARVDAHGVAPAQWGTSTASWLTNCYKSTRTVSQSSRRIQRRTRHRESLPQSVFQGRRGEYQTSVATVVR